MLRGMLKFRKNPRKTNDLSSTPDHRERTETIFVVCAVLLCGSSFSRTCPFGFGMFVVCIHVGGTDVHAIPTECLEGPLRSQSRIGSCRGQRWIDTRIEKLWADVEEKKTYKTIDISVVAHGRNHGDQTFAKFGNGTSQIVFVLHSPHMAANIRPWEKVKCSGGPCQKLR